ncbi:class I SAM-dependent methyltransferase [Spirulina sp. 06S082]|uniref:class I SAM-dependent methyltransferase n=1 Tax=Spirulina sp. 06S082 TaxID=3110248 RepID=UPI002B1F8B1E|nr:class I SAM-dependent methyltransferase [Spirulina sp. 06S082]MEA5470914.1 class I SAM-dependent methyltransferase [Spirulina sp. 06S082]
MQQLETTNSHPASFDRQAIAYDRRVGLSEETCRLIAETVLDRAAVKPGDLVVEVGAGTGQIGQWFGRSQPDIHYLGFDLSEAMLAQFRQYLKEGEDNSRLLQGDGNQPWPVPDDSTRLIFGSRSLHLLDCDRVVAESLRIAHPDGATLFMGSIERQEDSVKARMRKQMRHLLKQKGFQGRQKNRHQLGELFHQRGFEAIEAIAVCQWTVTHTPRQSLESWQGKEGIAGIDPPTASKQEILGELQTWAESTFGSLDVPIESEEIYLLQGIQINR